MKIKLSKSQWEGIGKKAGWTKISEFRYDGEGDPEYKKRLLINLQSLENFSEKYLQEYFASSSKTDSIKKKIDETQELIDQIKQELSKLGEKI